jgi:hypothetical protein
MPRNKEKSGAEHVPDTPTDEFTPTEDFIRSIVSWYYTTGSLERTADMMKVAYAKVRKILITEGEYKTAFSVKVGEMRIAGMSTAQIAEALNTTIKRVNAFLPYEKAIYKAPERTTDAEKAELYRKRIRVAKERVIVKNAGVELKQEEGVPGGVLHGTLGREPFGTPVGEPPGGELKQEEEAPMPWIRDRDGYTWEKDTKPVRLHLELKNDWLDDEQREILRKYGNSSTGDSISRDIMIPSDMPLHALHYAIQKLFGWQNSHLRSFHLPDEIYQEMTKGTVKGWAAMSGVLFYGVGQDEDSLFWDDDYQDGSFKVWLKKKYTGPYICVDEGGHYDTVQVANRDNFFGDNRPIDVRAGFELDPQTHGNKNANRILRKAPLIDLTLEELTNSIAIDRDLSDLLERLEVISVLAAEGDALANANQIGKRRVHPRYERGTMTLEPEVLPITHTLFYHYDYGDNWEVMITRPRDCADLLEAGHVTADEMAKAEATVTSKHKPVCLYRDGLFVMDDVGGLSGFVDFLRTIHEEKDADERKSMREWAAGMGWSTRKVSNELVL